MRSVLLLALALASTALPAHAGNRHYDRLLATSRFAHEHGLPDRGRLEWLADLGECSGYGGRVVLDGVELAGARCQLWRADSGAQWLTVHGPRAGVIALHVRDGADRPWRYVQSWSTRLSSSAAPVRVEEDLGRLARAGGEAGCGTSPGVGTVRVDARCAPRVSGEGLRRAR